MVQQREQYWVTKRKQDVKDFFSYIKIMFERNERSIPFLINNYSMKTGFKPQTVENYFNQLILARLIVITENKEVIKKIE